MVYQKTNWINDETPLSADNLNHMEDGIFDNSEKIENIDSQLKEKANLHRTTASFIVTDDVLVYDGTYANYSFEAPTDASGFYFKNNGTNNDIWFFVYVNGVLKIEGGPDGTGESFIEVALSKGDQVQLALGVADSLMYGIDAVISIPDVPLDVKNVYEMAEALDEVKANVYEYNDETRYKGVSEITFVVSEEAEKRGVTIVNNKDDYQYIDYITVDGEECWLNQALNYGEPLHFHPTEENAESFYDLWKAEAECEVHFSGAGDLENLDVSVFVPKKVDVKDCYDISKEAISESKKIDFLGLGVNRVVPSMYSYDLSFKSPYGNNCDVILDMYYHDTNCVPTNISINGYDFVIRSDWYNYAAGCEINSIDLYQNKLYYMDGVEAVLENLYTTNDGMYTPADAFGMNGGELEISFYDSNFDYARPFDIIFNVNVNHGSGMVKPEVPFGTAEEWTFTLEDGSTVTKKVVLV